ncbi:shikimate kinase [Periweissella beninensis]|uniref:Shikimate kinase n=1 Tax=Periweissella beninensis TaxID=504936 RepID=A0ABT0VGA3_9LACO|nr:shikimate kinase [Periweissella beninensis]MBM7543757.1 shikimate kinase [Periweissella beninensis]MCM2436859.1 chorismate mutase [Periweissella beninensis]MCT4396453.1 AAA family ATPase [Periweissella beninensis]
MKILLIGFMGVGKTTVGRQLATKLNHQFIDLDVAFKTKNGVGPSEFLQNPAHTEQAFRELEYDILATSLQKDNVVISTGGGVVMLPANSTLIAQSDFEVIYLDSQFSTVLDRLLSAPKTAEGRPLMDNLSVSEFYDLWMMRKPKYAALAKLKVVTDYKQPMTLVDEIKQALEAQTQLFEERSAIDAVDNELFYLLKKRFTLVKQLAAYKAQTGLAIVQPERMLGMQERLINEFASLEMPASFIKQVLEVVTKRAIKHEEQLIAPDR